MLRKANNRLCNREWPQSCDPVIKKPGERNRQSEHKRLARTISWEIKLHSDRVATLTPVPLTYPLDCWFAVVWQIVPNQATPISVSVAQAVARWYNPASGVPEAPRHCENRERRSLRVMEFEHSTFHATDDEVGEAQVSLTTLSSMIPKDMLKV